MRKKKVVAFVPIKLNSERLSNKNILPISGKPMCWHITNTLLNTSGIDETYVYCSDDKIKDYLPNGSKILLRDRKLDGNFTKGLEIYESFINEIEADIYILAHTTSPFIKSDTIENALSKVLDLDLDYDSSFSAQKVQTFAWYKGKPINYDIDDIPRTQDLEPIYIETSAFFIFRKELFTKHKRRIGFKPYIQEVNAIEGIDIDTQEDYDFALSIKKEN